MKKENMVGKTKKFHVDLRKPLTAFLATDVMLDKDPERHVGLMPAHFSVPN